MTCKLITILIFLCLSLGVYGQGLPKRPILVRVTAGDSEVGREAVSYINRELRGLGDVLVVTKNEDYFIQVSIVEVKSGTGQVAGYAMAILTGMSNYNNTRTKLYELVRETGGDIAKAPQLFDNNIEFFNNTFALDSFGVYFILPESLPLRCRRIVTDMDTTLFSTIRRRSTIP
jgi:hypothetical protein